MENPEKSEKRMKKEKELLEIILKLETISKDLEELTSTSSAVESVLEEIRRVISRARIDIRIMHGFTSMSDEGKVSLIEKLGACLGGKEEEK